MKTPRKRMVIACCSDDAYAPYCGVMLASAVDHTPDTDIRIYYLHDPDFREDSKSRLRQAVARSGAQVEIIFREVKDEWVEGLPLFYGQKPGSMRPVMWYRILLPMLAPDESKILYIDSDTLVVDDLSELWNTEITGKPLAAVTNPFVDDPRFQDILDLPHKLGLPRREDYFNSGVMLLNLDYFRQHDLSKKIMDHGRACAHFSMFGDQDSLSALFYRERVALPPRWNLMRTILMYPSVASVFPAEQVRAAIAKPAIVHFEGPGKPWAHANSHPYARRYLRFARRLPWKFISSPRPSWQDLENLLHRRRWLKALSWAQKLRAYFARSSA